MTNRPPPSPNFKVGRGDFVADDAALQVKAGRRELKNKS